MKKIKNNKNTVLLAMSGGVDSSVSGYLLKKKGYLVYGLFIKNWNNCKYLEDLFYAKFVSKQLKIKLFIEDVSENYYKKVFKNFIKEYKNNSTPNPDVLCNKLIKFNVLYKISKKKKINYISTGHYADIYNINNDFYLLKSKDILKDQTYFLYGLKVKYLKNCLFPLSNILKNNVIKIAKKIGLINYNKKNSTGICFVNNNNFKNFIKNFINDKKGLILDENNKIIGEHNGTHLYTIGQRKGLNIGGIKKFKSYPWYVIKKNIKKNIIYVTQNKKNKYLLSKGLIANKIHWINYKPKFGKIFCNIKIRYSNETIKSTLFLIKNNIIIIFNNKNGVVTKGQSVVIYINNFCLGGAIIKKSFF